MITRAPLAVVVVEDLGALDARGDETLAELVVVVAANADRVFTTPDMRRDPQYLARASRLPSIARPGREERAHYLLPQSFTYVIRSGHHSE